MSIQLNKRREMPSNSSKTKNHYSNLKTSMKKTCYLHYKINNIQVDTIQSTPIYNVLKTHSIHQTKLRWFHDVLNDIFIPTVRIM